jgi:hypothetical protein
VIRQFAEFTGCWPWQWTAAQAEAWVASGGWAHSTVRSYEGALALFLGYVCDPRYGWVSECEQRAGAVPVQVFHERNSAAHVAPSSPTLTNTSPTPALNQRYSAWFVIRSLPVCFSAFLSEP